MPPRLRGDPSQLRQGSGMLVCSKHQVTEGSTPHRCRALNRQGEWVIAGTANLHGLVIFHDGGLLLDLCDLRIEGHALVN